VKGGSGQKSGFSGFLSRKKTHRGRHCLSVREKEFCFFFREPGSDSEKRHRPGGVPGEEPQGSCDLIPSGQAEKGGREIPEKGHEDGRGALSRGAFVLPQNGVPDPVMGLDAPVFASE